MATTRLTREKSGSMLGGVCAGIAATYGLDVTLVRIAFVVLTIVTSGLGVLFYIAAWLVMPGSDQASLRASDVARANVGDVVDTARRRAADLRKTSADDIAAGAKRAAQDITRAASSAAQSAREAFGREPAAASSSASHASAASWTPPPSNPRARHGGFKPPRATPPSDRI